MARRNKLSSVDLPSLFDDIDNIGASRLPIHPDIARHAERVLLSGGNRAPGREVDDDAIDAPVTLDVDGNRIYFMSFGSGSSGNCYYIGNDEEGFLIDAGVETVRVLEALHDNGIPQERLRGLLLTHDHRDHTQYAYNIVRKHGHIPLYCTPRVLGGLLRRHNISRRIKDYHTPIYKEIPFKIGRFTVTAFEVMHDGTDNAGFFIEHGPRTMAVATDLGCISDRAGHYLRQADFMVIEANYDSEMLIHGPYPEHLKARINALNGHLDNAVTARFVAGTWTERLRYIFLCHLSHENNTPEKARETVETALVRARISVGTGCDTPADRESAVQLVVLPRHDATRLYHLR
ncbi:MAG: MBL fold metallo-hydrolase [Pseudoflavonifractor sp.]|nr:MBL fold metallo-hydrolase [Pseudoflavonifractor sp.]